MLVDAEASGARRYAILGARGFARLLYAGAPGIRECERCILDIVYRDSVLPCVYSPDRARAAHHGTMDSPDRFCRIAVLAAWNHQRLARDFSHLLVCIPDW